MDSPFVLSIAGFDPCGGAGILADIKTTETIGAYGLGVNTAITVQTDTCFEACHWLSEELILQQMEVLLKRFPIKAVKIGIVQHTEMLQNIVLAIRHHSANVGIIWDPIVKSSTGYSFFSTESFPKKIIEILPKIDLVTPNYEEIRCFSSEKNVECGIEAIKPHTRLLLKGGHRKEKGVDELYEIGKTKQSFFPLQKEYSKKHGSGCVLSSAIAAYYALTEDWTQSCRLAKRYTEKFLGSSKQLLGKHRALQIKSIKA